MRVSLTLALVARLALAAAAAAGKQPDEPLSLRLLAEQSLDAPTCNDGSPVGYYARLNNNSRTWIVYLQGGGFCAHEHSCASRLEQNPELMSSLNWLPTRKVEGILSAEPSENPYLWNANHVFVPYCSSDFWSGLSPSHKHGQPRRNSGLNHSSFSFMGSAIVSRVVDALLEDSGLMGASFVLLAGDSAGATGVMLNVDRVANQIRRKLARRRAACKSAAGDANSRAACELMRPPEVRGLADSGWLLDWGLADAQPDGWQPESSPNSNHNLNLNLNSHSQLSAGNEAMNAIAITARQAHAFWNGQMPAECASFHESDPFRCYFGHRAYRFIRSPVFLVQWLYDEAQLLADSVERPDWRYFRRLDGLVRASLANVSSVFAPSCLSHSLVNSRHWNQISVDGFRLPRLLNLWQEQPSELVANQLDAEPADQAARSHSQRSVGSSRPPQASRMSARRKRRRQNQNPSPTNNQAQSRQPQPQQPKPRGPESGEREYLVGVAADGHDYQARHTRQATVSSQPNEQPVWSPDLGEHTVGLVSSRPPSDAMSFASTNLQANRLSFRLIDSCGWPQCNRDCPTPSLEPQLGPIFES